MQSSGSFVRMMAIGVLLGSLLLAACAGPLTPTATRPAGDLRTALEAGQAALDSDNLAVAEQRYRDALAIDPRSAEAQLGLGNALVRQGKWAEAGTAYEAAVAQDPKLAMAHANLGVVYYQQENYARAVQEFDAALRLEPNDPKTLYMKAAARIQERNMVEAESLLLQVRDLDPSMPETYYALGVIYKSKGQKTEAIAAFEKFLELGPGQDPAAVGNAQKELRELKGQGGATPWTTTPAAGQIEPTPVR